MGSVPFPNIQCPICILQWPSYPSTFLTILLVNQSACYRDTPLLMKGQAFPPRGNVEQKESYALFITKVIQQAVNEHPLLTAV